jgi:hypothetical protein
MLDVVDVAETEPKGLDGQSTQDQASKQGHGTGASEDLPVEAESTTPADGARPHLDLLA